MCVRQTPAMLVAEKVLAYSIKRGGMINISERRQSLKRKNDYFSSYRVCNDLMHL